MTDQIETTSTSETPAGAREGRGTVKEIIKLAGGAAKIAEASAASVIPEKVSAEAVWKWPKIGIPDRHWPIIRGLCDVTAEELYQANVAARAPVSD